MSKEGKSAEATQKLTVEILKLSESDMWCESKKEWQLHHINKDELPHTCLCGHYPITELCVIKNKLNGNTATVGNVCVKKFIGLPSDKIFKSIRRISRDIAKSLCVEAVNYLQYKNMMSEWEYKFYLDTMRKLKLSDKQLEKRIEINRKLLLSIREKI